MYKKHFITITISMAFVTLFVITGLCGLIVYVDPLQIFHNQYKPSGNEAAPAHLYEQIRYRNAGLLHRHFFREQDKETVVLGTSLMENTLASDVERLAKLPKAINLAMGACVYGELETVYTHLLKSPSLKSIIIGIFPKVYFADCIKFWPTVPEFAPALYNGNPLTKIKAMYRGDILALSVDILRGRAPASDPGRGGYWMDNDSKAGLFSKYIATYPQHIAEQLPPSESTTTPDSLRTLIGFLAQTPEHIRVHVIIPPLFIGYNLSVGAYDRSLHTLLSALATKPNITLYGFDDVDAIVSNVANYKDVNHYGVGVSRYILRSIAEQKHILTLDRLEAYLGRMRHLREKPSMYVDTNATIAFEGPVNESAFEAYPPPEGPHVLLP